MKFQILSDLYQLPFFFGIWISDPALIKFKEEKSGRVWSPQIYLFADDDTGFVFDIFPIEDEPGKFVTEHIQFFYDLDNTELRMQHVVSSEGDAPVVSEWAKVDWGMTLDGCLSFSLGESVLRFVPTSIEGASQQGFDKQLLNKIADFFREEEDAFFQETFDLNTAYRLIDEAISREEDDAGMERGALGRPDPTTWVFGGDRFTGTV